MGNAAIRRVSRLNTGIRSFEIVSPRWEEGTWIFRLLLTVSESLPLCG